ncbi:MAG: class II glutamine amidotransferase [Oscillospiraceae bacterium]|nr:class II glutamine amidotransferase [Oscillospiraceae bacterium]
MCELFGFTSAKPTDIRDYLRTFYTHSIEHPHGWGLMYEDGQRHVVKEAGCASNSMFLDDLIESIPPQTATLAHIRFATVGSINIKNCHPFTGKDNSGREWTMIHNGTIFNGRHNHRYSAVQAGNTDSERFFLFLMDTVNEHLGHSMKTERERFEVISRFISENAPRNKLNLMIWDGDLLYVHKNLINTLCFKRLGDGLLFATRPLDDGAWVPFPVAQVIAYKHGQEVYRGDRHKGEFIPSLEYVNAMNAMHI